MVIDKFYIIIFICLVIILCCSLLKIYHIRKKVNELVNSLEDIEVTTINRKTLIKENDLLAPLVYQINDIVYNYEEKLQELRIADETNKQLMTSLSHDVRTPLTTLIGYLDAVHNELVVGTEQDEYIEIARQRAYDLKEYIDVLFDWFKLNSKEFTLSIADIEIGEATRCILKDWIPIFRENLLDFDIDIPEKSIMVNLDMDGYARVINNLIQNVISHSHADKIEILMRTAGENVEICIRDNGVGIAKEDLQHIFERLYKCDKGRSEKGSGLGLAIVHQMVELMGGTIAAQSILNEYTAFIIKFPLVKKSLCK